MGFVQSQHFPARCASRCATRLCWRPLYELQVLSALLLEGNRVQTVASDGVKDSHPVFRAGKTKCMPSFRFSYQPQ